MKMKEELKAIKEKAEILNKTLAEQNEEELTQVTGGFIPPYPPIGQVPNGTFDGSSKTVNIDTGLTWGSEKSEGPAKEWESTDGKTSANIPNAN